MALRLPNNRGYSMIELLLVLVIVGILAMVGISMLGNRKATAVRSLLDELEGSLSSARQLAVATGHDVNIYTWGTWDTTTTNSMVLAYGDAAQATTDFTSTVNLLLSGKGPNTGTPFSGTVAVPFKTLANDVIQTRARVSVEGSGDWASAMKPVSGKQNSDLTTLPPFSAPLTTTSLTPSPFTSLIADANLLFQGNSEANLQFQDSTDTNGITLPITISGTTQRFNSTFIIEVVGTSPGGLPMPGSPMGLLVVLANSATVYKFYNPGVLEGNGQWRRI